MCCFAYRVHISQFGVPQQNTDIMWLEQQKSIFFLLVVLETGSLKEWCQCSQVLVRALFVACRRPQSHYVLIWQGERESTLVSFLRRALISSSGPYLQNSSKPPYFPKIPFLNTFTLEVRLQFMNLGEHNLIHSRILDCLGFLWTHGLQCVPYIDLTDSCQPNGSHKYPMCSWPTKPILIPHCLFLNCSCHRLLQEEWF